MDLMVVRMSKTGKISNAEPCYHCMQQLKRAAFVNIKNVYYSNDKSEITCKKFTELIDSPTTFISSGYRRHLGIGKATHGTTCRTSTTQLIIISHSKES